MRSRFNEQLDSYRPWEMPHPEGRPFVAMNFAVTVDGRATIGGVSGPIGSEADTAMLVGLRSRFDAVMIGAGTMRAERYSGLSRATRRGRESGPDGRADLPALLHTLHEEGVRALLCEGGPTLHGALQAAGLVDEPFLTVAPKLVGGEAPRIVEGDVLPETCRTRTRLAAGARRRAFRPLPPSLIRPEPGNGHSGKSVPKRKCSFSRIENGSKLEARAQLVSEAPETRKGIAGNACARLHLDARNVPESASMTTSTSCPALSR